MSNWDSNEEIQIFREYLRIPSVHPDIDYGMLNSSSLSEKINKYMCAIRLYK